MVVYKHTLSQFSTMKTAALFLNGDAPNSLALEQAMAFPIDYKLCTDGAFYYMETIHIVPDAVIGDMDSLHDIPHNLDVHFIDDQDTTDFEKALDFLSKQDFTHVVVLGSTGGQHDHFLGNLNAAYKFRKKLDILFFDQSQRFYLIENNHTFETRPGNIVSLVPYPQATIHAMDGLQYTLNDEILDLHDRIGTRNIAISDQVKIEVSSGALWLFIAY